MELGKKTIHRIIIGALLCIVAYWLLHEPDRIQAVISFLDSIFSPFIIGACLAFVLNVPMRAIEKLFQFVKNKALRRAISLTLSILAVMAALAAILWVLVPEIIEAVKGLIERLPVFFNDIKEWALSLMEKHPDVGNWINDNIGKVNWDELSGTALGYLEEGITVLIPSLVSLVGSIYNGVFNAVISVVFAVYCLVRKEILATQARRILYSFVPERISDQVVRILRMTNATFSGFISGQCLEACILGTLFAIAMTIFRMPYIPLICVLIAVTALVPIVGAFIGCVVGAFFILVVNPIQAVWFVVMFLILQQFENNVIYPKVVGRSVGLPGMWVLLAVAVGGAVLGVVGMLLMIPVFSVLYTLMRELTEYQLAKRGISEDKVIAQPINTSEERKKKREFHKKRKKPEEKTAENTEEKTDT